MARSLCHIAGGDLNTDLSLLWHCEADSTRERSAFSDSVGTFAEIPVLPNSPSGFPTAYSLKPLSKQAVWRICPAFAEKTDLTHDEEQVTSGRENVTMV
jgi:hypothetical protein